MSVELLLGLVALGISIYAILDVRKEVKKLIAIERNRAYSRILNDMAWLFINATERAHSKEIAKGLEEFSMLAKVLNPERTPDISTHTVNNEALAMADRLVKNGYRLYLMAANHRAWFTLRKGGHYGCLKTSSR